MSWGDKYESGTVQWDDSYEAFVLPHQCQDWSIGDADDVRRLIADLEAAIRARGEAPR